MFEQKITFDRLIRWIITALIIIAVIFVIDYLSNVLLPFFVAWLLAYLIHPLVKFTQYKLHVPTRALSIVVTLIFIIAVIFGVCYLIFPPMIEQFEKLGVLITRYVQDKTDTNNISQAIQEWLRENNQQIQDLLKQKDVTDAIKSLVPGVFNMLGQTANIIISVVASLITLLYMFFILLDYEYLTSNWIRIFPKKSRPFWQGLASDVERELNNYIRGQGLVALIMGILFCIGFTIIDFPMAIGLGILIGIMDLVPYLHTFALIPTAFLALLKAVDTGQNFWMILGAAVAVFCIVQVIIDLIVTPKIMGKAMRLNPAILLLSLSVWGALLGFIGLIIALPLTTIIMAYYKRYITKEEDEEEEEEKLNEPRKSIFSRILKRKEALKEMSAKAAETTNADATTATTATEENKKSTE
jgi:predicted PurR-regulated permease PerM